MGVEGVCAQRMSLNCCSHWPVARAAQFVFVAVGGVVGEIGDAWGLAWVGGGGWTGDSAWGMGRSGGWVRGEFHRAVVLVDLALGLPARVGLVGWGGGRGCSCSLCHTVVRKQCCEGCTSAIVHARSSH